MQVRDFARQALRVWNAWGWPAAHIGRVQALFWITSVVIAVALAVRSDWSAGAIYLAALAAVAAIMVTSAAWVVIQHGGWPIGAAPAGQPSRFDFRSIVYDRPRVDLSGLFATDASVEPAFTVKLNLRNTSGCPVEITGVEGQPRIDGKACKLERTKEISGRLVDRSDYWTLEIEQPVTQAMKDYLIQPGVLWSNDSVIRIDLSGLQLRGTVDGPNGHEALKGCHLVVDALVVLGPIRSAEEAGRLQRWETLFGDSEFYDNRGRRRRNKATGPATDG